MDHGEASINTICHDQLRKLSINLKSIIHLVYGSSNVSNTTTSIVCFCRLLSHLTESHITIFNLWIFVINMYQLCCNFKLFFFFIVVDFVIHWNETAMGLHVLPIPIPPPTSLSMVVIKFLWLSFVFCQFWYFTFCGIRFHTYIKLGKLRAM